MPIAESKKDWMPGVRRFLPVFFLILCIASAFVEPRIFIEQGLTADFSVFWAAATMALQHPELIYNDVAITLQQIDVVGPIESVRPWAYPPSALLPLIPFGLLPYKVSLILFVAISASLYLLAASAIVERRKALAFALIVLAQPVIFAALSGQLAFIVAAFVIGALVLLPTSPVRAGLLLGIAAAIKPTMLLFAPIALVADHQYRALAASIGSGLAMIIVSMVFGPERWFEWLSALGRFGDTVAGLDILERNVTPTGILWYWGVEGPALRIAWVIFAMLGAWMAWQVFRHSRSVPIRLVALIGAALFASPYAMNYDLVLLVPAAVAFIVYSDKREMPLLPILAGGILIVSNKGWTPPAAVFFIAATLWSYLLPARLGAVAVDSSDGAQRRAR